MNTEQANKFVEQLQKPWTSIFEVIAWHIVLQPWTVEAAGEHAIRLLTMKASKDIGPPDFNPDAAVGGKHGKASAAWDSMLTESRNQPVAYRSVCAREGRTDLTARTLRALRPDELRQTGDGSKWAFINKFEELDAKSVSVHVRGLPGGAAALGEGRTSDEFTSEELASSQARVAEAIKATRLGMRSVDGGGS